MRSILRPSTRCTSANALTPWGRSASSSARSPMGSRMGQDPHGAPRAEIDVTLVDLTGQMAAGRLRRGANPVLVTFELVLLPG